MQISLKDKLKIMLFIMTVPLIAFIFYLILKINSYTQLYNEINHNVVTAAGFIQEFKDSFDYSMYRIIIGSSDFYTENIKTKLDTADDMANSLIKMTEIPSNKSEIKRMKSFVQSLSGSTEIVRTNLLGTEPCYDKNMAILNNDIYPTTALIGECIQSYIYNEAIEIQRVSSSIEAEKNKTYTIILFICVILILFTLIYIEIISNSITKPIKRLCKTVQLVGEGDFTTRADNYTANEISSLTFSVNNMIEKIQKLVENVENKQKLLRNTELKLLQEQINPHFLYNTLDTVIWLAESDNKAAVIDMIGYLSCFFRTTLNNGKQFIRLEEEIEHIHSYLQIQKMRYSDILEYSIDVPEELNNLIVLKLTLQPIIENALYHGIKNRRGVGLISVSAEIKEKRLAITVNDNGAGITPERLEEIQKLLSDDEVAAQKSNDTGFGLFNVNERIKLNYGNEYGVKIKSKYSVYTAVTVYLPINLQ